MSMRKKNTTYVLTLLKSTGRTYPNHRSDALAKECEGGRVLCSSPLSSVLTSENWGADFPQVVFRILSTLEIFQINQSYDILP